MFKIGIVGYGFVGKATNLLCNENITIIYDKNENLCIPKGTKINDLNDCSIIFICVQHQ